MARPIRTFPPDSIIETTLRTVHRMFLLRPSPRLNRLVIGVLARAQEQTGIIVYGFSVMSNHAHFLLRAESPAQLAAFQQHIGSNIAKEACRLHDWSDRVWARRYAHSELSDEDECHEERLLYIHTQGIKEGLVERATDWPGATATHALTRGELEMRGIWIDRTALDAARRRTDGDKVRESDHSDELALRLTPLPAWEEEPSHRYAAHLRREIRRVEEKFAHGRELDGKPVLGKRNILAADPHYSPGRVHRTPPPICLAASLEAWIRLKNRYLETLARFQNASFRFRRGDRGVVFPENTFPPAPWLRYDTS